MEEDLDRELNWMEKLITSPKFEYVNSRGGFLYLLGLIFIGVGVYFNDPINIALGVFDILIGIGIYIFMRKKGHLGDKE